MRKFAKIVATACTMLACIVASAGDVHADGIPAGNTFPVMVEEESMGESGTVDVSKEVNADNIQCATFYTDSEYTGITLEFIYMGPYKYYINGSRDSTSGLKVSLYNSDGEEIRYYGGKSTCIGAYSYFESGKSDELSVTLHRVQIGSAKEITVAVVDEDTGEVSVRKIDVPENMPEYISGYWRKIEGEGRLTYELGISQSRLEEDNIELSDSTYLDIYADDGRLVGHSDTVGSSICSYGVYSIMVDMYENLSRGMYNVKLVNGSESYDMGYLRVYRRAEKWFGNLKFVYEHATYEPEIQFEIAVGGYEPDEAVIYYNDTKYTADGADGSRTYTYEQIGDEKYRYTFPVYSEEGGNEESTDGTFILDFDGNKIRRTNSTPSEWYGPRILRDIYVNNGRLVAYTKNIPEGTKVNIEAVDYNDNVIYTTVLEVKNCTLMSEELTDNINFRYVKATYTVDGVEKEQKIYRFLSGYRMNGRADGFDGYSRNAVYPVGSQKLEAEVYGSKGDVLNLCDVNDDNRVVAQTVKLNDGKETVSFDTEPLEQGTYSVILSGDTYSWMNLLVVEPGTCYIRLSRDEYIKYNRYRNYYFSIKPFYYTVDGNTFEPEKLSFVMSDVDGVVEGVKVVYNGVDESSGNYIYAVSGDIEPGTKDYVIKAYYDGKPAYNVEISDKPGYGSCYAGPDFSYLLYRKHMPFEIIIKGENIREKAEMYSDAVRYTGQSGTLELMEPCTGRIIKRIALREGYTFFTEELMGDAMSLTDGIFDLRVLDENGKVVCAFNDGVIYIAKETETYVPFTQITGSQNTLSGIVQGENGAYYYYIDGKQSDYTGLASNEAGTFYFANGILDWGYNGFVQNEAGWWCVAGGRVCFEYTGLWSDAAVGWWYVKDGRIDFSFNGLVPFGDAWWCVAGGRVCFEYTGLWSDANVGWWYVENGAINFNHNGLVPFGDAWWCVAGGRVCFEYTGLWSDANVGWWYVENGAINFGYNGLIPFGDAWWCVAGGRVAFEYTGLWYDTVAGWWYVENGAINFGFNGAVDYNGGTYNVAGGMTIFV